MVIFFIPKNRALFLEGWDPALGFTMDVSWLFETEKVLFEAFDLDCHLCSSSSALG